MNKQLIYLCHRAPLAGAAALLGLLSTSAPVVGSEGDAMIFTGGSFGSTVDSAIQGAFEDAANSASVYQLYTCHLVGEPQIFPGPNPEWNRNFTAQVDVACTP